MFDVSDDAKVGCRRVEVLTGPERRRQWSEDEKARILAETMVAAVSVSAVARRWQVCPQQVFGWRRWARLEGGARPRISAGMPAFVPIVSDVAVGPTRAGTSAPGVTEVRLAAVVMRAVSGIDAALLAMVLREVRASASRS